VKSPSAITAIIAKTYALARPYGQKKLVFVAILAVIQGFATMVGISSIFPFLALASDPQRIYQSPLGKSFMQLFPSMDHNQLLVLTGILAVGLLFLSSLVNIVGDYLRVRYVRSLGHRIRLRLLNQLLGQPYSYFLDNNSAILTKKVFNDVNVFVQSVLSPILDGFARIVTVLFLIGALLLAEPTIATIATLFVGTFYVMFIIGLHPVRARMSDGAKSAVIGLFSTGQTIFSGIKVISVSGHTKYFVDRFAVHSKRLAHIQTWLPVLGNSPRYLLEPVVFGGLVGIVVIQASQGREFVSLLPSLGVMALAFYKLLPNLQWIYGQLNLISTQRHALEEIHDELKDADRKVDKVAAVMESLDKLGFETAIEFRKVEFRYPAAKRTTIHDVSFRISKNAMVGLIGETGSGKSTLIDLLLGLHSPSSGDILVDDVALESQERIRRWQNRIGYVPQDIYLLDGSVGQNIAFGIPEIDVDRNRVKRAAEIAQIAEFIESELPNSYGTLVGERGVRLSGGQRQRIALARAFYHDPDVLVLDEATSALDHETEARFMKVVSSLRRKFTIVIVAHRLTTLEHCDEIYRVRNGYMELLVRTQDLVPTHREVEDVL
jgi:ABC-type multidrug transport system fused ATPase/permease subunit